MVNASSLAAVQIAKKATEVRSFPLPDVPPDAGLMRVLAAGICGSDVGKYNQGDLEPRILGHENVGVIEKLGSTAAQRWGLKVGDVVALEEYLPCGHCDDCRIGEFRACLETDGRVAGALRYGTTTTNRWPALWGGYSQYQYLDPRSIFHRVPEGVDPRIASMALPLGNGFQWAYFDGGAGPGQTVLVQGPGQQGLACVIAAKAAGASIVIATGLKADAHRLEAAKLLGADHTVMVDEDPLVEAVTKITGGRGVDLIVNASAGDPAQVVSGGLKLLRNRGVFVTAAARRDPMDQFDMRLLIQKRVTLRGVRGHSFRAVEMALEMMSRKTIPLEAMATHHFGLDKVDHALRIVSGEIQDGAIHVAVAPWN